MRFEISRSYGPGSALYQKETGCPAWVSGRTASGSENVVTSTWSSSAMATGEAHARLEGSDSEWSLKWKNPGRLKIHRSL